jgi:hypothetical protein
MVNIYQPSSALRALVLRNYGARFSPGSGVSNGSISMAMASFSESLSNPISIAPGFNSNSAGNTVNLASSDSLLSTGMQKRGKKTRVTSYRVPPRAGAFTRSMLQRPQIGVKALSSEYVETGRKNESI